MRRRLLAAALSSLALSSLALAFAPAAHAADQQRAAPAFSSINVRGAINVIVDRGAAQSLTVLGDERFLNDLVSEVVGGELRLSMRDDKRRKLRGDEVVVVKMPALRAFRAEGAGEIKLNDVRGERFDVNYRGAGSLQITGEVKTFTMQAEGVGEVDARSLLADNTDVTFRGVGDVRVHARNRLDAKVQGIGSLTYYGKPRIVNKSASGLGSVDAGN